MRIVKCYECGKHYNYDEDGFCPQCGAFNQPRAASRIGADGSVIWVDGINRRNHEGSFVHKELHEENRERRGTALDQGRKKPAAKRSGQKVIRQPLAQRDGTPTFLSTKRQNSPKKGGISRIIWIGLGLLALEILNNI